jgi:preprotein translocase subunit SecE
MKKIKQYIKESYDELMHKVSWPTWSELQNSAIVVSVASLIIAIVIFLLDIGFRVDLDLFYLGKMPDAVGFMPGGLVLLLLNIFPVSLIIIVFTVLGNSKYAK